MSIKKPQDLERNELITQVMNIDGMDEAERITGKHVDLDKATENLGIGLQLNKAQLQRKLMVEAGDFLFSDMWSRRVVILARNQFRKMFAEEYMHEGTEARLEVWLEQPHGLVFVQNVYRMENGTERNLDHGRVNFAYLPHGGKDKYDALVGLHASGGWESVKHPNWRTMPSPDPKQLFFRPDDLYFRGYFEGDGMIHKLQNLLIHGEYANPWPEWEAGKHPLATWFSTESDYAEVKAKGLRGMDAIALMSEHGVKRYESFPEELQRVINVKPTWRKKK